LYRESHHNTQPYVEVVMKIGVVGVGAVGLCWARELRESGYGELSLADPFPSAPAQEWAAANGVAIARHAAAPVDRS